MASGGDQLRPETGRFDDLFSMDYSARDWDLEERMKEVDARMQSTSQWDILVKFLLNDVVAAFGVPTQVISDRGSIFTDQVVARLFTVLGVRHNNTTAYHPQANGRVERMHRILKSLLNKMVVEDNRLWPD